MRLRHIALLVLVAVCMADAAAAGLLGRVRSEPPAVAALAAQGVSDEPPVPQPTMAPPTYAPRPFLSPVVTTLPTPALPSPIATPTDGSSSRSSEPSTTTALPTVPDTQNPDARTPSSSTPASVPAPSFAARARGATIAVYASRGDTRPAYALQGTSELGGPRVFLATALEGEWVRVVLPLRPNGSEGFVRAADVEITEVHDAITVSLAERTLVWTRGGEVLMRAVVAVGAASSPTPPGRFYVTDLVEANPNGPYGAWILALNGYSESFATFAGGDPRLAIHGTDQPATIGRAASNGCVRVGDADLDLLAAGVPLGTPVTIS